MTAGAGAGPAGWTDREGIPLTAPEPPDGGAHHRMVGDYQGAAYERNAFAFGTAQEVAWLRERLPLGSTARLIDVGCGTGRHARELANEGAEVVGVDVSAELLRAGRAAGAQRPVSWVQSDARALPLPSGCADAVLSLCQGAFGTLPGGDAVVLAEMARVLRPGGRLVLTAFSLAFAARYLAPDDALDLSRGLVHSHAEVRNGDGHRQQFDLWTTCYSPAHLADLLAAHGLRVDAITGCEPGAYRDEPPRITDPELLVQATRDH